MGDQLGPLVDELLARTRDIGAAATTRAQVRKLLRHAEGLLGVHGAYVETFTMTSTAGGVIFPLLTFIADGTRIGRILEIRSQGKSLVSASLSDLRGTGPSWLASPGEVHEAWLQWGWDQLVLWPRVPTAQLLEIVATAAPLALDNAYSGTDTDTLTLTSKWSSQVLDLAEVLMLLRWRHLDGLRVPLERLKGVLQL